MRPRAKQRLDHLRPEFRSGLERSAWEKVAERAEFHWSDLVCAQIVDKTAMAFARRWVRADLAVVVRREGSKKFLRNAALDHDALDLGRPRGKPTPELNMWRAMRLMGRFTARDLSVHASTSDLEVTTSKAQAYCLLLLRAGYLRSFASTPKTARKTTYQLINNTGPDAPVTKRVSGLFDPNERTFAPSDESDAT